MGLMLDICFCEPPRRSRPLLPALNPLPHNNVLILAGSAPEHPNALPAPSPSRARKRHPHKLRSNRR